MKNPDEIKDAIREHTFAIGEIISELRDDLGAMYVELSIQMKANGRCRAETHIAVAEAPPIVRQLTNELLEGEQQED